MTRTFEQAECSGEKVEIETAGSATLQAFLARPGIALPPRPGMLVLHEIMGLNEDIRRICLRFASAGYVALAPDIYSGRGPRPLCVLRTLRSLARRRGATLDGLEGARAWLAARPEVDAQRIGVAGFCMGGGFALMLAVRAPLGAVATFYGDVPQSADELRGTCPILGGYGARDRMFGPAGHRLEGLLSELGVEHDVVVYPGVGHSYMNRHGPVLTRLGAVWPMHAGYCAEAADDSWRRMLAFFETQLS